MVTRGSAPQHMAHGKQGYEIVYELIDNDIDIDDDIDND
jgi:hypothetical protein